MRPSRISCEATNRAVLLGDREAESLRRQDRRGVDADHVAARRHQRPAGVAGIQRRVGLDDVVHQPPGLRRAATAERADDAGGHRVMEAERVADRDRDLADAHGARVAERRPRQRPPRRRRGCTARSVSGSRPTTSASSARPSVIVTRVAFARADDVGVGQDEAVGREDRARSFMASGL